MQNTYLSELMLCYAICIDHCVIKCKYDMMMIIIRVAEQEIVFRVLDTVIYCAQGVQVFSEIMLRCMKIQLT